MLNCSAIFRREDAATGVVPCACGEIVLFKVLRGVSVPLLSNLNAVLLRLESIIVHVLEQ